MNAKDQAALDALTATLKAEFALALKDALAPFIITITELEQRSSNFAARVNAHNKAYRAEIAMLREQVAALTPKAKAAPAQRVTPADWDWAMAQLKAANPSKTFFAPGLVRATAEARVIPEDTLVLSDADEEVSL